jgi:hypothetical protein
MPQIRIEYDDDALRIIEKINRALAEKGLKIQDDEQLHDGFCIFDVVEIKKDSSLSS